MFAKKIGIDLGTANTLVHLPKKGIVVNEPSVVAVSITDNKIMAIGEEAKKMIGRTPEEIMASCPLKDGVIADYRITEAMLRYLIDKVMPRVRLFKPEVMVAVPVGITSTERRAVVSATIKAGAKMAYIIKEPVAAAIGAGIPIEEANGNLIVDIGGGTSEVAVLSLGGIVASASKRTGGLKLDQAIADYVRKKHNLAIGRQTVEQVKIKIGSAIPLERQKKMEIQGRDMIAGLPKTITITTNEICDAMQDELREIIQAIKEVLQETPPELSADVINKGIVLSGGGALLTNIDKLIAEVLQVPTYLADEPLLCVAKGTGIALDNLDSYKKSILSAK